MAKSDGADLKQFGEFLIETYGDTSPAAKQRDQTAALTTETNTQVDQLLLSVDKEANPPLSL